MCHGWRSLFFLDSTDCDDELTKGNRPSGDCCLKGHIHVGNPRGKFETIAGVDTYIVSPNPGQSNVCSEFSLCTIRMADSFLNRAISCFTMRMYAPSLLRNLVCRLFTCGQVFGMFTNAQLVMDSYADTLSVSPPSTHY